MSDTPPIQVGPQEMVTWAATNHPDWLETMTLGAVVDMLSGLVKGQTERIAELEAASVQVSEEANSQEE